MTAHVSVGVPVYRGELYLEEALHSIQQQTYKDFDVLISVDGPDPACEAICAPFLKDARFRMVVQPERLGWVGNYNWIIDGTSSDFLYLHQQDDLTDVTYIEALLDHALDHPEAAVTYCDVIPFGRVTKTFEQPPSIVGATPFVREISILHEQFPAFALRGLVRNEALKVGGHLLTNEFGHLGVDACFLASMALAGELHRVPLPLYHKRYHATNTESAWWTLGREERFAPWANHCSQMLEQALRIEGSAGEMRLLFAAGLDRLTTPRAARFYLPPKDLAPAEYETLFRLFFERARRSALHDIPLLLDASWEEIERWCRGFYWKPDPAPVEIVRFGPNPITAGVPFNLQDGGSSSLWLETSRRLAPGSQIRFAGADLPSTLRGTLITALVPPDLTTVPGPIEALIVGPDGAARSPAVTYHVLPAPGP